MVSQHVPTLDSLELLSQVASTGSLGRASVAHGISQPAVSARIRGMEAQVGFALVQRTTCGSTLTPAGALLTDWARDVLDAAEVLDAGLSSLRAGRDARLHVAASMTVAEHLLPRWLVRLATQRPHTAVSLEAMNSTDVAATLLAGGCDLGFVEGPVIAVGLDARLVGRDHLVVVVAPDHPWARRRRPIEAAELAATRLVHREPTSGTRIALEVALQAYGPLAIPILELSTNSAVRLAVVAQAGPAVLSELAIADAVATGRLVRIRVRGVNLTRVLNAVWPHGQHPVGPARDLLGIAAGAGELPPAPRSR
jgi:DNA-binding transcriptional LysR family regulator